MPYKCFNCSALTNLHMAPTTPEIRHLWLAAIPNLKAIDFNASTFRLCSLHFDEKYFSIGGRLARNGVPSKFVLDDEYIVEFVDPSINSLDEKVNNNENSPANRKNTKNCSTSTAMGSPPNKKPKEFISQGTPPSSPSEHHQVTGQKFRYVGDIDVTADYSPRTARRALAKFKEEIDKTRQSTKELSIKYNRLKTRERDMLKYLDGLEKGGLIDHGTRDRFNKS